MEDQIDGRRKEVGLWIGKCESVEEECARYCLALGSDATSKGVTGSVAEARKEPILPMRHGMLIELQEKLRQVSFCLFFPPWSYGIMLVRMFVAMVESGKLCEVVGSVRIPMRLATC